MLASASVQNGGNQAARAQTRARSLAARWRNVMDAVATPGVICVNCVFEVNYGELYIEVFLAR